MATEILRPTRRGENKPNRCWKLQGPWGEKEYPPISPRELYDRLRSELIDSKLLSPDARRPTNKKHDHVSMLVIGCSWDGRQWLKDTD